MLDEKTFAVKLNQHLNSMLKLDVDTVFNVIYNALVSWVHKTYKDVHEYNIAYDKYIKYTRDAIRQNHYYRSVDKTQWFDNLFQYEKAVKHKNIIDQLVSALHQMPPEVALKFLSELTSAWCLSCSREKAKQYIDNENISDVDLADTLFTWLLRPFDFFN